ncbi:hypothetical protein C8J57DRAFT_1503862 [Mycena rebaudengoi]|nr:hypothetical protein C8J57DRAFT_1503862 [Mycena rebaudengoi]
MDFKDMDFLDFPKDLAPSGSLLRMDLERDPVWYYNEMHWLAYTPSFSSAIEFDPIGWVFEDVIDTVALKQDIELNDDQSNMELIYGYHLDHSWKDHVLNTAKCLHIIMEFMVQSHYIYGHNGWKERGSMPGLIVSNNVDWTYDSEKDAIEVGAPARRIVMSHLGFVNWFMSCKPHWTKGLEQNDVKFVEGLDLRSCLKVGALFLLHRDRHKISFRHMVRKDVPIYFPYTDVEEKSKIFFRYSPPFLQKLERISQEKGFMVQFADLPGFDLWREDIARHNKYLQ